MITVTIPAREIVTTLINTNSVFVSARTVNENLEIYRKDQVSIIKLADCIFKQAVTINLTGGDTYNIDLSGSEFHENVEFTFTSNNVVELFFVGATFKKGFTLSSTTRVDLDASNIRWKGEIILEECPFRNLKFIKAIGAKGSTFTAILIDVSEIANFSESQLGHANFEKAKFGDNVSFDRALFSSAMFMNAAFNKDLYFNLTDFGERANFNGSQIQGKVVAPFINQKSPNCIGDFSGCSFGNSVYFDSSIFHKFICIRSTFKGLVSFNNSKYWFADLIGTHFSFGADFSNTKYAMGSIETCRIIKSELLKGGNKVESLYYQSQELNRYDAQITWRRQPLEKFMFVLNRLSSNHGINWGRGVLFTFFVSMLFYCSYVLSVPGSGIKFGWIGWNSFLTAIDYFFKNYFKFIAIFREFTFIDGSMPNAISYAIDFFGRIFIGYGIYQTIQAFRKYGKS